MRFVTFADRSPHRVISVKDTDGNSRNICKCQLKERHVTDDEQVDFPVFECPEMTKKYGYGTEEGL